MTKLQVFRKLSPEHAHDTHISLSSCTSYCSVLLNVKLLFAFATKEWRSVFFERMVTLSTSPVSDALGPQACQQMDNT